MTDLGDERRSVIERYLAAYNAFDVGGMVELLHPGILFRHVSGGETAVATSGIAEFRALAEQSASLFSSRRQEITGYADDGEVVTVEIAFSGVLARDFPGLGKAGESLRFEGRSVFQFQDGRLWRITDTSQS